MGYTECAAKIGDYSGFWCMAYWTAGNDDAAVAG